MADIDLKTLTPDTSLPTTGFLFGADSQASASPSVYSTQTVATTLLGSTSLTGATLTTSQPVLDLSQTWNAGAVTFTGLKFNATDTASAAASLLMDLQVGGTTRFQVRKDGRFGGSSDNIISVGGRLDFAASNLVSASLNASNFNLSAATLSFTSSSGGANSGDLILGRRAAANLRLGAADAAAPVAQTLSVQSVVAGTSNTAGVNLTITGSQGTGTGAGGSIVFQVAPAGSTGTAQNALATALTITSDKIFSAGGMRGQDGYVGFYSTIADALTPTNAQRTILFTTASSNPKITLNANSIIGFSSATSGDVTEIADTILRRDAANTLALRNGAAAQNFNVYNTHTSSTNYEAINIGWDSNNAYIGANIGSGGGTRRPLRLFGSEVDFLIGTTTVSRIWLMNSSGHFLTGADNTYDIGTSSGSRPRNVFSANTNQSRYFAFYVSGTTNSSTFMESKADGLLLLVNAAGSDFGRLQFGGTTSSFPALKRSSTTLQARLADDSGFASVQGKITTDTAYAAGDPTTTGYLVVYDSTGTAYKIPAVAV